MKSSTLRVLLSGIAAGTTSTTGQILFLSLFVGHSFLTMTPAVAEICTLCADGSYPSDPGAKFSYEKNGRTQTITCDFGYTIAPKGEFNNCTALHKATNDICSCSGIFRERCNLCPLDKNEKIPDPNKIVASKTCSEWELIANGDFEDDCRKWQLTMGVYCGCKTTPELFDGFCRLCNTTSLPDPNVLVNYTDGTSAYCSVEEQDINTKWNFNCTDMQTKYKEACKCGTGSGTSTDSLKSSATSILVSAYVNQRVLLGSSLVMVGTFLLFV